MPESAALALAEVAALLSNHARGDVVCQAAQLVEGLTGTKDGLDELVRGAELVVPPLVGTLVVAAAGGGGKEGGKTAEAAAAAQVQAQEEAMREHLRRAGVSCAGALVNLSQRKEMVPMLVQRGALAAAARLLARRRGSLRGVAAADGSAVPGIGHRLDVRGCAVARDVYGRGAVGMLPPRRLRVHRRQRSQL